MINPAELDLKEESVIRVTRVAKVTSRGKNFRFGALVAIGDGNGHIGICLLYTSDAADEGLGVDLGGRRII